MNITKKSNEDFKNLDIQKILFKDTSKWDYGCGIYGFDNDQWVIYKTNKKGIHVYPFSSFINKALNNNKEWGRSGNIRKEIEDKIKLTIKRRKIDIFL